MIFMKRSSENSNRAKENKTHAERTLTIQLQYSQRLPGVAMNPQKT